MIKQLLHEGKSDSFMKNKIGTKTRLFLKFAIIMSISKTSFSVGIARKMRWSDYLVTQKWECIF